MAWDAAGRYYYQSKRIDGRPTRVYVGGGLLGKLAAETDAAERAQRAAQGAQWRQERAEDAALYKSIDGEYRRLRAFVWALLTATGHYQHKREWRRMDMKRLVQRYAEAAIMPPKAEEDRTARTGAAGGKVTMTQEERAEAERALSEDLDALVARVNGPRPTRADLDALRAVLAAGRDDGPILTCIGGSTVLGVLLDSYTKSEASKLVMRAEAERMGRTLGRAAAPPFERPLIDHIILCWVRLQLVERDHANNTAGAHNRDSGRYWDRRLTEAQRRYLRAVNLLAKLRHMGPLQVNIANQQVVMNGGGRTEGD